MMDVDVYDLTGIVTTRNVKPGYPYKVTHHYSRGWGVHGFVAPKSIYRNLANPRVVWCQNPDFIWCKENENRRSMASTWVESPVVNVRPFWVERKLEEASGELAPIYRVSDGFIMKSGEKVSSAKQLFCLPGGRMFVEQQGLVLERGIK